MSTPSWAIGLARSGQCFWLFCFVFSQYFPNKCHKKTKKWLKCTSKQTKTRTNYCNWYDNMTLGPLEKRLELLKSACDAQKLKYFKIMRLSFDRQTVTTLNYFLICLHEHAHYKSCKKLSREKIIEFFGFFSKILAIGYLQK